MIDDPRVRQVLEERARELAKQPGSHEAGDPGLSFRVAADVYTVALTDLAGVLPFASCARVPWAPGELLGVASWRGRLIPVADLARLFGSASSSGAGGYALVLRAPGQAVGVRVGALGDLVDVPRALEPLASSEEGRRGAPFVKGVTRDGRFVLDAAALVAHPVFAGGNAR